MICSSLNRFLFIGPPVLSQKTLPENDSVYRGHIRKVLKRLSVIYPHIFIDEVQDLSGYDLEFLKLLFNSSIKTVLVGDPRQGTYSTNNSRKNRKFSKSAIIQFFDDELMNLDKDDTLLTINHRCIAPICDFSSKLFPLLKPCKSGNIRTTDHDGLFLVRKKDVDGYLSKYSSTQLRDSRKLVVNNGHPVMNFGESKGLSFDRILIYTTGPIASWLKDNNSELKPTSRSKLYVAITRARHSVAFVYDFKDNEVIEGLQKYVP